MSARRKINPSKAIFQGVDAKKKNRTQMNIEANRILKFKFQDLGVCRCEMCGSTFMLRYSHRKKRRYYSSVQELSDINQVLLLCANCDNKSEYNRPLLESWFVKLRG